MREQFATGLALTRIVLGVIALAAPTTTQRLSLLEPNDDPGARTGWRYFGVRAIGLGVGYLTADERTRRHLHRAQLLVDSLDTAFIAAMAARRSIPLPAAAWLGAITGSATAIGVANVRTGVNA